MTVTVLITVFIGVLVVVIVVVESPFVVVTAPGTVVVVVVVPVMTVFAMIDVVDTVLVNVLRLTYSVNVAGASPLTGNGPGGVPCTCAARPITFTSRRALAAVLVTVLTMSLVIVFVDFRVLLIGLPVLITVDVTVLGNVTVTLPLYSVVVTVLVARRERVEVTAAWQERISSKSLVLLYHIKRY